jgi:hypothetical protein
MQRVFLGEFSHLGFFTLEGKWEYHILLFIPLTDTIFSRNLEKKGKKKKDMNLDTFSDLWQLVCHIWCKSKAMGWGHSWNKGPWQARILE